MKTFITFILLVFGITGVWGVDHSHSSFDSLLKKHVSSGWVSYKGFQSDRNLLDVYLNSLSKVSLAEYNGFSKEEKIAFLVNAYNAFTIQLILDHYPVKSIKKIGGIFQSPWKIEFFELLGAKRSLDWIEHQKLRVDFQEPRIHFAIVCASIGCPPLANTAFTAKTLETQLQSLMLSFLADKNKNRYDSENKILYLSPIFDWFESDFTKKGSLVDFVNPAMGNLIPQDAKIKYTNYNWNLNEK